MERTPLDACAPPHHPDARLGTDPATAGPRRCAYAAKPAAAAAATAEVRGPTDLKPGEYLWHPEISPTGPIVLVVSLDEQRAYVYRNGIAIGLTTISSGKAGHETPTGVFTILQKDKDHRSNLYNSADAVHAAADLDGIALHGGSLPGHPASHGCVRLPQAFAQKLFRETQRGDTVVVADAKSSPMTLAYPSVLAPVNARGQACRRQRAERRRRRGGTTARPRPGRHPGQPA